MPALVRTLVLGTAAEMAASLNKNFSSSLTHYSLAAVIPIDEPTKKAVAVFQQTGNATNAEVRITETTVANLEATTNGLLVDPANQGYKLAAAFLLETAKKVFVVLQKPAA